MTRALLAALRDAIVLTAFIAVLLIGVAFAMGA